jgi:hypothetical protein
MALPEDIALLPDMALEDDIELFDAICPPLAAAIFGQPVSDLAVVPICPELMVLLDDIAFPDDMALPESAA